MDSSSARHTKSLAPRRRSLSRSQLARGVVLAAFALFGANGARAVTIGFDDLAHLDTVTTQYQPFGVIFTGHLLVLGPGPTTNPVSPPNSVAFFDPTSQTLDYTLRASFVVPGTNTPATTDFVAFTPTDASSGNTLFVLRAFDANGSLLGSTSQLVTSTGTYDPGTDVELSVSAPGISYIEMSVSVSAGNRVIEGDDFRFNQPVPEPAVLALLGIGAVAVGALRLRGDSSGV